MTIYYIDPDGGNDANDGLSFANRWRTFSPLTNVSGDDEVRVMGALDPNSLGTAQWTDNSTLVTLASAKTLSVDNCDTAWTASTNVTAAASTSTTSLSSGGAILRQGTAYARINAATAFTTGIMAYRALPSTLDLSGYTALSMRFAHSVSLASIQMRLDLCSDAVGAVPVASFNFPLNSAGGYAYNVLFENGGPLPSGVNSIALYAVNDPGTAIFGLDDIIACQSRGHSDHICHSSLIGKNNGGEPQWYPIRSIDGVNVYIGDMMATPTVQRRPYHGTTESVETYCQPMQIMTASGSISGLGIKTRTFAGGWDRTSMTEQTANDSFVYGSHYWSSFYSNSTNHWMVVNNINFSGFMSQPVLANGLNVTCEHMVDNQYCYTPSQANQSISCDWFQHNIWLMNIPTSIYYGSCFVHVKSNRWDGSYGDGNRGLSPVTGYTTAATQYSMNLELGQIRNCQVGASGGSKVNEIWLRNTVFVDNNLDLPSGSTYMNQIYLDNCTLSFATDTQMSVDGSSLRWSKLNGDPEACGRLGQNFNVFTQTTTVPSGETRAWQLYYASGYQTAAYPLREELFSIYVTAGKSYTINFQTRYNNARMKPGAMLVAPNMTEYSYSNPGAGTNSWVSGSLNFTATEDGIATFFMTGIVPDKTSIVLSDTIYIGAITVTEG